MSTANSNGLEEQREELIAKAERSERKRKKKEEKQRRKAEKRAEKKRILEEENGNSGKSDDDSDIEIIEDDNGVCTVSIQPRPIKLTIKTNGHQNPSTSNSMNDSGKLTNFEKLVKTHGFAIKSNKFLAPKWFAMNNS